MIGPSQRLLPDNTHKRIHAPGGVRTHNSSNEAATDSRPQYEYTSYNAHKPFSYAWNSNFSIKMVIVHDVLFKQKHYVPVWSNIPLLTFLEHHILLPLNCTSEYDSRSARQGIPAVYETQRIIPVLTTDRPWTRSISRQIQSAHLYSIYLSYNEVKKTRVNNKHPHSENFIPTSLCTWHSVSRWYTSDFHGVTTGISVFFSLRHQAFFLWRRRMNL